MTELLNVKKSSLKLSPGLELRATISKRLRLQQFPVQTQAATWEAAADQGDTALGLGTKELLVQSQSAYTTLPLTGGQPSSNPKMDAFPVLNNFSFTLQSKVPYQPPPITTIPVHTGRPKAQGVHLSRVNLSRPEELLLHQSLIYKQQQHVSHPTHSPGCNKTVLWHLIHLQKYEKPLC